MKYKQLSDYRIEKNEDSWLGVYWRPAAAIVYLVINIFDFLIFPIYFNTNTPTLGSLVLSIKDLPADSQNIILNMKLAAWEPLTLKGGAMFHLSFGAILTGATIFRGQERIKSLTVEQPSLNTNEEPLPEETK